MELDKRRWYVTWFFLSLAILDKFRGRNVMRSHEERYRNGTNLCHFMRVTLVWAPLVILLHMLMYVTAFAFLTILPMRLFGMSGYVSAGLALGLIILCVIAAIAIVAALVWALIAGTEKFREMRDAHQASRQVDDRGPTFLQVIGAYLAAKKQQVCPMINFSR